MIRNKILIQYTIVSLVIIIILAGLHGFVFSRRNTDHLIKMHLNMFLDIINHYVEDHPAIRSFFIPIHRDKNTPERESMMKLFSNNLRERNGIFGIQLINNRNQLVWNDPVYPVDKEFQGNNEFLEALNGVVAYRIEEPDKDENTDTGWILDIYIPVLHTGKVIGVMEMHEHVTGLKSSIKSSCRTFWIIIFIAGSVLYCSLFFIFYRANRNRSAMLERLEQTQDVMIFALAYQAELRDYETGKHLDRTVFYVNLLAEELRKNEKYSHYLTDRYISDLVKSAPLHDIGKAGVPDSILRKPGALTGEEFEVIKKHCRYGLEVLEKASARLSFRSFLVIAIQLVGSHHEKWDGSGYPKGLSKDSIPISGRIMALADVYDALRSHRIYKESFPHDQCLQIILGESGKHFDPEVVKAFQLHEHEFSKISDLLCD